MKFRLNHMSILFIVCWLCLLVAGPAWSATALWTHNVAVDTGYNWLVMPDINGMDTTNCCCTRTMSRSGLFRGGWYNGALVIRIECRTITVSPGNSHR